MKAFKMLLKYKSGSLDMVDGFYYGSPLWEYYFVSLGPVMVVRTT